MTHTVAHRGLSDEEPENTVAAFRAAADAGFDAIELDLRMTHDDEVVVLHDASIARTTDGTGRVAELDYDELRTYDTGHGPVPRLDDVLAALDGWSGYWNLEVKVDGAVVPARDIVEHRGLEERTMFTAMDPGAIRAMQAKAPDIPRGLITLGPLDLEDLALAGKTDCRWVNVDHDFLTADVVRKLGKKGFEVGAWTVNDPERALELVAMGVGAVITDVREVQVAVKRQARRVGGTA